MVAPGRQGLSLQNGEQWLCGWWREVGDSTVLPSPLFPSLIPSSHLILPPPLLLPFSIRGIVSLMCLGELRDVDLDQTLGMDARSQG